MNDNELIVHRALGVLPDGAKLTVGGDKHFIYTFGTWYRCNHLYDIGNAHDVVGGPFNLQKKLGMLWFTKPPNNDLTVYID